MVATIGVVMAVVCEAHVPLLRETSSIAMSPEKPFPTSPSNVIWNQVELLTSTLACSQIFWWLPVAFHSITVLVGSGL